MEGNAHGRLLHVEGLCRFADRAAFECDGAHHALLTAEAVAARGLRLAGWVANRIEPTMPHAQLNIDTLTRALRQRHDAPLLGVVSYRVPASAAAVAEDLRIDAVLDALDLRA